MSLRIDSREWDDLAVEDAFWAVCSVPGRLGTWSPEEFFESGDVEVDAILRGLDERSLAPQFGRALDFGCGPGRLSRALSSRFDEVVGVDLSPAMIAAAERLNGDRPNCHFHVNQTADLSFFPDSHFDFVLSLITLQHVSSRELIGVYIGEFVRVARPGAVIVFQLPSHVTWRVTLRPLRVANRLIRLIGSPPRSVTRLLMKHSTSLHGLPEAEVRSLLAAAGSQTVAAFDDGRGDPKAWPSLSYVAIKSGTSA